MGVPKVLGFRTEQCKQVPSKIHYPVVLMRGLGRSSAFWLDFPKVLSEYATVHMVDLLGSGRSPSRFGRGSIPAFARDVVETLKREGLLPCHLVGISLGGMVAAEVTAQLGEHRHFFNSPSENIVSLGIIASSARFTKQKRIAREALVRMLVALRKKVPQHSEFARYLVSQQCLERSPHLPSVWDSLWKSEGVSKLATLRQLLSAALFDGRQTLSRVTQPTLVMTSVDDGLVSWTNTPRIWETIPQAEMCLLHGLGHDLPTEDPQRIANLLVNFFERVERESVSSK